MNHVVGRSVHHLLSNPIREYTEPIRTTLPVHIPKIFAFSAKIFNLVVKKSLLYKSVEIVQLVVENAELVSTLISLKQC